MTDQTALADLASPPPTRRHATVLVVDDDPALRRLYRQRLESVGYVVHAAGDGAGALAAARGGRVDAVLIDVMMPDVDGWGVLAALRDDARTADAKLILMSADQGGLDELARVGVDADGFLLKGGRSAIVIEAVDAVLARRFGILAALPVGVWGPLSDVGVQPLLHAACDAGVCGVLTVDDATSSWSVVFDDGVIARASARSLGGALEDREALLSLLEVREAPFSFDVVEGDETIADPTDPAGAAVDDGSSPLSAPEGCSPGVSWGELAAELCDELNARRARMREHLLSLAGRLAFDERRMSTWARRSSGVAVDVANALAAGASPRELIAGDDHEVVVIDRIVQDLLRRGVVSLAA